MGRIEFEHLDNMKYGALVEEPDATIKYANPAFCSMFNISLGAVVGKNLINDFLILEDREKCNVQFVVTPESPNYTLEGRAILPDGKIHWLQFVGHGEFNAKGELIEFQETLVDITTWKEKIAAEVKELNKSINIRPVATPYRTNSKYSSKTPILTDVEKKVKNLGHIATYTFEDIITCNPKMELIKSQALSVASTNSSVLIEGESGTGKELFAQAIHNSSNRANGPFVAINCGAISPELLQSELFGYEGGTFTGAAKSGKIGKFELADSGTLFLDEIGDMPFEQQIALLRVLETRTLSRMGGDKVIPLNVRIICATNKVLFKEVCENRFRSDLYYRLNVINIKIPPLRERKEDLPLLANFFYRQHTDSFGELSEKRISELYSSQWPGNIRELNNFIERIVYMPEYDMSQAIENEKYIQSSSNHDSRLLSSHERHEDSEEARISKLLEECRFNITVAAKVLGVSRKTLYKKIEKYGITIKRS